MDVTHNDRTETLTDRTTKLLKILFKPNARWTRDEYKEKRREAVRLAFRRAKGIIDDYRPLTEKEDSLFRDVCRKMQKRSVKVQKRRKDARENQMAEVTPAPEPTFESLIPNMEPKPRERTTRGNLKNVAPAHTITYWYDD